MDDTEPILCFPEPQEARKAVGKCLKFGLFKAIQKFGMFFSSW